MIRAIMSADKGVEYYYIVGILCLRYVERQLLNMCDYLRQPAECGRQFFSTAYYSATCISESLLAGVIYIFSRHRREGGGGLSETRHSSAAH